MPERVPQWLLVSVVTCSACSLHDYADPGRSSAAADVLFGAGSTEDSTEVAQGDATTVTASDNEALCPADEAELPGVPLWLQSFDGREVTSVASDSAGNVLLARAGGELRKLSCAGTALWSKPFGAQVAVDGRDDVYVAGMFSGALAIDDSTLRAAGTDAFLVKLDAAGNVIYARTLGLAGSSIAIDSLAVDGAGRAALSGTGLGTVKVDEEGNVLWRKSFSGKVQFDGAGNLLLSGALTGTLELDTGNLSSQGGSDVLLLKLGLDGAPIFAYSYGDAGALQAAEAVAVDAEDNVVIAGTFDGQVDFGAGRLEAKPTQCSSDAWCLTNGFAAKFDAQGRAVWSIAFGPARTVSGLAIDPHGNSVLSGALPGGVRPFRQTWLAKLDPTGAELWRRSEWPDTGIGAGHGVAVDRNAYVFWSLSARPSLELEEQSHLAKLTP